MINVCLPKDSFILKEVGQDFSLLKQAVWIDLFNLTLDDEHNVEKSLNINIPTREEMSEIEISSRLYKEADTFYMTATMIAQSDSPEPKAGPVTFMLTPQQLITIRYIEPHAFKLFINHLKKIQPPSTPPTLFIELLDATIDRLADILEVLGQRLDDFSKTIFPRNRKLKAKFDYQKLMQQLGADGDLNSKIGQSLITFNRLITFFSKTASSMIEGEQLNKLEILHKDIISLSDHVTFLSNKVNFLLDATLGMISIEQNNIIKIFSVAAVIFLPPTLIASIYGMNFKFMPELFWKWGYLTAIFLMILAAWLPYRYFKYRKWL